MFQTVLDLNEILMVKTGQDTILDIQIIYYEMEYNQQFSKSNFHQFLTGFHLVELDTYCLVQSYQQHKLQRRHWKFSTRLYSIICHKAGIVTFSVVRTKHNTISDGPLILNISDMYSIKMDKFYVRRYFSVATDFFFFPLNTLQFRVRFCELTERHHYVVSLTVTSQLLTSCVYEQE
jgi:hypothetical protein